MKLVVGITAPQSTVLIRGQLKYFVENGYEVYLLAPKSDITQAICEEEGATLISVQMKRDISIFNDFNVLFKIFSLLYKIKPDVVNFGTPKVSLLGMIATLFLRVPRRIYTCRGFRFEHELGFKRKLLILLEKITALSAHRVVCISKSVQELGIKNRIFDDVKSLVINKGSSNGVNLELFSKSKVSPIDIDFLKKKYNLENKFIFGFVGRIIDRKGISELYESFSRLYKDSPNIRLLLVGPLEENQIGNKNLINQINNHVGIINIGKVSHEEVPKYLSLMQVFVLPAYWEGFGNVLIQAAAMGVPVISTYSTGCKDAVKDNFNGELVNIGNIEDLTSVMLKFSKDFDLLKKYSENGVKWSENFSQELIWSGLHNLYQENK